MGDIDKTEGGVSRRTVTKAMAWAVPVVAVATAVPGAAASVCNPEFSYGGNSCKCPGEGNNVKEYYLSICVTDASGCPLGPNNTLYIWGVKNNSNAPGVLVPAGGYPVAIPIVNGQGCSESLRYDWDPEGSGSSAAKLEVLYNFSSTNPAGAQTGTFFAPPDCPEGQCGV